MIIIAAAIKIGDKIVSGINLHAGLVMIAFHDGLMPKRSEANMTKEDSELLYLEWGYDEGFLSDTNEFLTRDEAAALALANGQATETYRPNELHVPDVIW